MRYFCSLPYQNNKWFFWTPIYKKKDPLNKETYLPLSVLSYISKIVEKTVYEKMNSYMEPRFSLGFTNCTS